MVRIFPADSITSNCRLCAKIRFDLIEHRVDGASPQGEQDANQFELPSRFQLLQRHLRNQFDRNRIGEFQNDQHLLAPDQRETSRQKDAVEQIDRLGGGILP
jgi:hypothetical protein